jgi:hypothetical protein
VVLVKEVVGYAKEEFKRVLKTKDARHMETLLIESCDSPPSLEVVLEAKKSLKPFTTESLAFQGGDESVAYKASPCFIPC